MHLEVNESVMPCCTDQGLHTDVRPFIDLYLPIDISGAHEPDLVVHLGVTPWNNLHK